MLFFFPVAQFSDFLYWFVVKDWRCNGKGYVAYHNYICRPRNWENMQLPSVNSTPGNRLLAILLKKSDYIELSSAIYTVIARIFILFIYVEVVAILVLVDWTWRKIVCVILLFGDS